VRKIFYSCTEARTTGCKKYCFIAFDDKSNVYNLFLSSNDHNHEIRLTQRLPMQTKERVKKLMLNDGIFDATIIKTVINKEELLPLTDSQLKNYLSFLKRKLNFL